MANESIAKIIDQLEHHISQIEASGPVAEDNARLDISTHSKSGHRYARLRNGTTLTACGRVHSRQHIHAWESLQRRDKIAHLRQAIAALKAADECSVILDGTMPESKQRPLSEVKTNATTEAEAGPKLQPPAKKPKKQLYTHVKTRRGSLIHAVLGKDKLGEWRTAALCGAKPPKSDRMGWGFPTIDDGVDCPKCYRKLPPNGEQYHPIF